jgi:hypothetical protein
MPAYNARTHVGHHQPARCRSHHLGRRRKQRRAVGKFDVVLGSRILSGGALNRGMPLYKYVCNRFLTAAENFVTGAPSFRSTTRFIARSHDRHSSACPSKRIATPSSSTPRCRLCLSFGYRVGEVSCPNAVRKRVVLDQFQAPRDLWLGVLGVTAEIPVGETWARSAGHLRAGGPPARLGLPPRTFGRGRSRRGTKSPRTSNVPT